MVIQKHVFVHVTRTPELSYPIIALHIVPCNDVQRYEPMLPVVVEYLHTREEQCQKEKQGRKYSMDVVKMTTIKMI